MKICFVVNDTSSEEWNTSTALIAQAHARGHTVYLMDVGDFNFNRDKPLTIDCIALPKSNKSKSAKSFIKLAVSRNTYRL